MEDIAISNEFDDLVEKIRFATLEVPKYLKIRCDKWMRKFVSESSNTILQKNRNLHADLLLHCLETGVWLPPFDKSPPDGPLRSLPTYLVAIIKKRKHERNQFSSSLNQSLERRTSSALLRSSDLFQSEPVGSLRRDSFSHIDNQLPSLIRNHVPAKPAPPLHPRHRAIPSNFSSEHVGSLNCYEHLFNGDSDNKQLKRDNTNFNHNLGRLARSFSSVASVVSSEPPQRSIVRVIPASNSRQSSSNIKDFSLESKINSNNNIFNSNRNMVSSMSNSCVADEAFEETYASHFHSALQENNVESGTNTIRNSSTSIDDNQMNNRQSHNNIPQQQQQQNNNAIQFKSSLNTNNTNNSISPQTLRTKTISNKSNMRIQNDEVLHLPSPTPRSSRFYFPDELSTGSPPVISDFLKGRESKKTAHSSSPQADKFAEDAFLASIIPDRPETTKSYYSLSNMTENNITPAKGKEFRRCSSSSAILHSYQPLLQESKMSIRGDTITPSNLLYGSTILSPNTTLVDQSDEKERYRDESLLRSSSSYSLPLKPREHITSFHKDKIRGDYTSTSELISESRPVAMNSMTLLSTASNNAQLHRQTRNLQASISSLKQTNASQASQISTLQSFNRMLHNCIKKLKAEIHDKERALNRSAGLLKLVLTEITQDESRVSLISQPLLHDAAGAIGFLIPLRATEQMSNSERRMEELASKMKEDTKERQGNSTQNFITSSPQEGQISGMQTKTNFSTCNQSSSVLDSKINSRNSMVIRDVSNCDSTCLTKKNNPINSTRNESQISLCATNHQLQPPPSSSPVSQSLLSPPRRSNLSAACTPSPAPSGFSDDLARLLANPSTGKVGSIVRAAELSEMKLKQSVNAYSSESLYDSILQDLLDVSAKHAATLMPPPPTQTESNPQTGSAHTKRKNCLIGPSDSNIHPCSPTSSALESKHANESRFHLKETDIHNSHRTPISDIVGSLDAEIRALCAKLTDS